VSGTVAGPARRRDSERRDEIRIDGVIGHRLDPYRSGVARFNQILAERLGVPVVGFLDQRVADFACPLLSFKAAELSPHEIHLVEGVLKRLEGEASLRVFLHEYLDLDIERTLVRQAELVYCGNDYVYERVHGLAAHAILAWAPGNILDVRPFPPADVSVFSFGMAHKVRVDMFRRLGDLLESTGKSYVIYMSNANHETARPQDAQVLFDEMHALFPDNLYFMGNLSDVAVSNYLRRATFFAAFFKDGVRANNGSVAAAMEHGAVVITNLDRHSPAYLVHMDNLIDINQCDRLPSDRPTLERLSARAAETAQGRSWDRLLAAMRARSDHR
jgi:hypothetical protein